MALGKIKADTLEHSTAGTVDTQYVVNGSVKAYVLFDQGVPEIDNSFNTSSLTDSAEGNGDVNWTNAMSNALYITVACTGYVSTATAYNVSLSDDTGGGNARTSSKFYFVSTFGNASATVFTDNPNNHLAVLGDLA